MAHYTGKGWHFQSKRHSNARKYGKAGGTYAVFKKDKYGLNAEKIGEFNKKAFLVFDKNKYNIIKLSPKALRKRIEKAQWNEIVRRDEMKTELANREQEDYAKALKLYKKKKSFGYAQKGFETFPINKEYSIEAHWEKTSRGFRHIVRLLKNGMEVDKATANYLNRTWERFDYESAIHKLLGQNPELMNEQQRKDYLDALSNKNIEKINKEFGMIGAIASLGDVLGKTQKERIDWKARMIKAGLGDKIDMPEDWDKLTDNEKEARLNKVIEYTKTKKNYGKKDKLFSVYDEQTNRYLMTGRNVKTEKEAIEDAWSYWEGGADWSKEDEETASKWNLKQKKEWLVGQGFRFDKHKEKISEKDDF